MANSAQPGFQELLAGMPADDADFFTILSWCLRFNAYDRWGGGPELLHDLVLPLKQHYDLTGRMHEGTGYDGIRALMFYKAREHHFTDYPPEELVQIFKAARTYVEQRAAGHTAD